MKTKLLFYISVLCVLSFSSLGCASSNIDDLGNGRYRLNISATSAEAWKKEIQEMGMQACSGDFTEITSALDPAKVFIGKFEGYVDIECQ